jgi:hypothetical protein
MQRAGRNTKQIGFIDSAWFGSCGFLLSTPVSTQHILVSLKRENQEGPAFILITQFTAFFVQRALAPVIDKERSTASIALT